MTKKINKQRLDYIRDQIKALTEELALAEGLDIQVAKGKYSNADFGELTIKITNKGGITEEAAWMTEHYKSLGFDECPLGKQVGMGGKVFTIVGMKWRAKKNTVLIEDEHGNQYACTPEDARNGMMVISMGLHING